MCRPGGSRPGSDRGAATGIDDRVRAIPSVTSTPPAGVMVSYVPDVLGRIVIGLANRSGDVHIL